MSTVIRIQPISLSKPSTSSLSRACKGTKFTTSIVVRERNDAILDGMGTPSERQAQFLGAIRGGVKFPLYGGARGGGKSWALRRAMAGSLLTYPKSSGLLLRRSYPDISKNHIRKLSQELPKEIWKGYNSSNHILTLPNGSTLEFGYCKNDQDVLRYQGNEYDFVGIDEGTQWQQYWYECIRSSVRSPRGYPTWMAMSANPGGIGHMWVKTGWIDDASDPARLFVPAKVYDNPILMLNDPDYVANLEGITDENLRRAWLNGDWDIFAGQFFHELRRDIHGFHIGDLPEHGWVFRMLDYGERAPSAVYWGKVDTQGGVWLFRELYGAGYQYPALAEKIKQMSPEPVRYTVGSPDIFATSKGTGVVGSETMAANGVAIVKADNNRVEGWRHMREWMDDPRDFEKHPPKLHVCVDTCPDWWRTVPAQVYDEHVTEDMDGDGEDHAAESTRYGLRSRPAPARLQAAKPPAYSSAGVFAKLRQEKSKGRRGR